MNKKLKYRVEKMTESDRELLQSVAFKLKDRVICPEKFESAMKFAEQLEKQPNLKELFNEED